MTLSNAYVLWGNGKNGFTQTLLKSYPNGTGVLGVGDLNQDSAPDILVGYSTCVPQQNPRSTTTCAGIDAFYGGQGPQKTYYRNLVNNPNFQQPYSNIFAVDINGDGIGDIATLDGSGAQSALYVWLGHPDGSFDQNPWQFTATTDGGPSRVTHAASTAASYPGHLITPGRTRLSRGSPWRPPGSSAAVPA